MLRQVRRRMHRCSRGVGRAGLLLPSCTSAACVAPASLLQCQRPGADAGSTLCYAALPPTSRSTGDAPRTEQQRHQRAGGGRLAGAAAAAVSSRDSTGRDCSRRRGPFPWTIYSVEAAQRLQQLHCAVFRWPLQTACFTGFPTLPRFPCMGCPFSLHVPLHPQTATSFCIHKPHCSAPTNCHIVLHPQTTFALHPHPCHRRSWRHLLQHRLSWRAWRGAT